MKFLISLYMLVLLLCPSVDVLRGVLTNLLQMFRSGFDFLIFNTFLHAADGLKKPVVNGGVGAVVCYPDQVDPPIAPQHLSLIELRLCWIVDGHSKAAIAPDCLEGVNIAYAIAYVDHVLERDAPNVLIERSVRVKVAMLAALAYLIQDSRLVSRDNGGYDGVDGRSRDLPTFIVQLIVREVS